MPIESRRNFLRDALAFGAGFAATGKLIENLDGKKKGTNLKENKSPESKLTPQEVGAALKEIFSSSTELEMNTRNLLKEKGENQSELNPEEKLEVIKEHTRIKNLVIKIRSSVEFYSENNEQILKQARETSQRLLVVEAYLVTQNIIQTDQMKENMFNIDKFKHEKNKGDDDLMLKI